MSKISKQDGYVFAGQVQDFLDELSLACERYYGLSPQVFQQRNYSDVRSAFVATPVVMVRHDFELLVTHRNDGTLHNVNLVDCRDPSNFGSLNGF